MDYPPTEETVEGYRTTGRRTPVNAHVWVARSLLSGRPWLRFLRKSGTNGWHVAAYKRKRDAIAGPLAPGS